MEKRNRIIMWTILSTCFALAVVQLVDAAAIVDNVQKSEDGRRSLSSRPFEKYMIDLYNIMFDKEGQPRKGIATMDDEVRCFLPEISNSKSKISLKFDIREVKKNEQVTNAYLIFPKQSSASDRKPTGFVRDDAAAISDSSTSPLNLNLGGWKSNDVTSKVKTWHKRRRKENTIYIDRKGYEDDIFSRNLQKILQAPFLVVHSKSSIKQAKRSPYEAENINVNPSIADQGSRYKRGSSRQFCRREKMNIKLSKLGWDRFILAPSAFDAFRCEGKCGAFPLHNAKNHTWHTSLQGLAATLGLKQDGKPIEPPCCAPVEFTAVKYLTLRKVKGQYVIEMKNFPNMVAQSCACI